jgi:hypothetical protein
MHISANPATVGEASTAVVIPHATMRATGNMKTTINVRMRRKMKQDEKLFGVTQQQKKLV